MDTTQRIYYLINNEEYLKEFSKEIFNDIDIEKKGFISKENFKNKITAMASNNLLKIPNNEEIENTFKNISEKGDDKISIEEFTDLIKYILNSLYREK